MIRVRIHCPYCAFKQEIELPDGRHEASAFCSRCGKEFGTKALMHGLLVYELGSLKPVGRIQDI